MEDNILVKAAVCLTFTGLIILFGVLLYGAFILSTICGWILIGLICIAAGALIGQMY